MLLLIFGTAGIGHCFFTIALPGLRSGKLQARGANLFAVKRTSQILVWYSFLVPDVFDDACRRRYVGKLGLDTLDVILDRFEKLKNGSSRSHLV
jgi:hypothetical protein